jgi:predicted enzyme related to lactoylglutathione lyase
MSDLCNSPAGAFCWVDLAARDERRARAFYAALLGWTYLDQSANGGRFTRIRRGDLDVGSLYQLDGEDLQQGVPSHWTAYVHVADVDEAARRTEALGGRMVVRPFTVDGIARIALILDAVGAPLGLWGPAPPERNGHG